MTKLFFAIALGLVGCATMASPTQSISDSTQSIISLRDKVSLATPISGSGFNISEAKQFLEFCIELNNQDDRNNPQKKSDPQYQAAPSGWKIVYDSRHPGNTEWNKTWPDQDANNPEKTALARSIMHGYWCNQMQTLAAMPSPFVAQWEKLIAF